MQAKFGSFDDIQEKLLELGSSTKKRTTTAVGKGYAYGVNKMFETATSALGGGRRQEQTAGQNHDTIPYHLIEQAKLHKDQQELDNVRAQLAALQNGDNPKSNERSAFNSFFRKYQEEEKTYFERKKREEERIKHMEEKEALEKKKQEEEEKERQTQQTGAPQGKIRKSLFAKVKKRSSMIETKASSGKQ